MTINDEEVLAGFKAVGFEKVRVVRGFWIEEPDSVVVVDDDPSHLRLIDGHERRPTIAISPDRAAPEDIHYSALAMKGLIANG